MNKINRIRPTYSTKEAAAELGCSKRTVERLVTRGSLHATPPVMSNGHWVRFIFVDAAFKQELARRKNGLKAPRQKHVAPQQDSLEKCRNAMNICLQAVQACSDGRKGCEAAESYCDRAAHYCATVKVSNRRMEELHTRCTAILATACILQLLIAAYYTLCHFNIV